MRVEAAKQANQNHGRQTKREADVEDDAPESGAAPTAPPDLYDILGLCRANSLGNPPGHMPGVRFATREPAAVIQTVIHAPLFCTFSGVRIWRKSGETQW